MMWPLNAKQIYEILTESTCPNKQFELVKIEGVSTDSRKINNNEIFVAIKGDQFDGHSYLKECFDKGVPLALVQKESLFLKELTPDEKNKCIAVDDVLSSFRKFAKFMRSQFPFPVIGIGGSNGKTTTKEMLYSMLLGEHNKVTKTEKSENGFLGMALTLTQKDHNTSNPPTALVLEIGIDTQGAMIQHVDLGKPDIALLTALGPEHLEGLKTWEIAAQEELILFSLESSKRVWQLYDEKIVEHFFETLKNNRESLKKDFVVIEKKSFTDYQKNIKPFLSHEESPVSCEVIWNIVQSTAHENVVEIQIKNNSTKQTETLSNTIPLPGKHNAANFSLAFAAALLAKKSVKEITCGFQKFSPPDMRSKISTLPNGAILYNDAYNASPMSVIAALASLDNKDWKNKPKIVVLGDMLDLGSESKHWHEYLLPTLKNLKHTHLCLYGSAMYDCYKLLKDNEDRLLLKNKTRVFWLDATKHPGLFLDEFTIHLSECLILVKGSRGMQLERFVRSLEEKCR